MITALMQRMMLIALTALVIVMSGGGGLIGAAQAASLDPFGQNTTVLDPQYRQSFGDNVNDGLFVKPDDGEGTIADIRQTFFDGVLPAFQYLFIFVAILFWVYYIFRLIVSQGDSDELTRYRQALLYGFMGFAAIALAVEIAQVLGPIQTFNNGGTLMTTFNARPIDPLTGTPQVIDTAGGQDIIQRVIFYMQLIAGIIAIVVVFYAGVRMITARGNEERLESARNLLIWGVVGLILIMLSAPLVNNVFYPQPDAQLGDAQVTSFAREFTGALQFFLQFLGLVALLSFITAGAMYLTSFDNEERTSRARSILYMSAVGIVVILSSYTIITFLAVPPTP